MSEDDRGAMQDSGRFPRPRSATSKGGTYQKRTSRAPSQMHKLQHQCKAQLVSQAGGIPEGWRFSPVQSKGVIAEGSIIATGIDWQVIGNVSHTSYLPISS